MYHPLKLHHVVHELRRAAVHYDCGFWDVFRRAHQLHEQSLFSITEMRRWGLLDPAIPDHAIPHYISKEARTRLEIGLNSRKQGAFTSDKEGFYHALEAEGLSCPRTYGTVPRPSELEADAHRETWIRRLAELPDGPLILKPVDGFDGTGVWAAVKRDGRFAVEDQSLSTHEFYQRVLSSVGSGQVIQERLQPHPSLVALSGADALQCLRIVTLALDNASPQPLYALLKLGAPESPVDNFHLGELGKILVDIDLDTGRIRAAYGKEDRNAIGLTRHTHHPRTGSALVGTPIPFWNEALELVQRGGSVLPPVATLGWDIGLTPSGPVIVEANIEWEPMPIAPVQGDDRLRLWREARRRLILHNTD